MLFEEDELVTETPEVPKKQPVTKNPDYQDNVVDSRIHPITELVTHIEGFSWTVNYYGQVLGGGQVQEGQDLSGDDVLQQYTLIKNLELKVISPLASTQDEETREFNMVGSSHIYAGHIPNTGDMFTAIVGDGKVGILEVTEVIRKNHLATSCYEVGYTVVDYLTEERKEDLLSKVVTTYIFHRDRLINAASGLLSELDTVRLKEIKELLYGTITSYYDDFYSHITRTLTLDDSLYDPHITNLMTRIVDHEFGAPNIRTLILSCTEYRYNDIYTWLLEGGSRPVRLSTQMAEVDKHLFRSGTLMNGVRHARIDKVIFPYNVPLSVGTDKIPMPEVAPSAMVPTDTLPDVLRPTDGGYVFSMEFYSGRPCVSKLENEVRSFLSGDVVNATNVINLTKSSINWTEEERFFYLPVMILLLKTLHKEL